MNFSTSKWIYKLASDWPAMICTIVATIISSAALFTFAALGWPGGEIHENCFDDYLSNPKCLCERPRGNQPGDVWFAQPVNSASNISFVIVGFLIAIATDTKNYPNKSCWDQQHGSIMAKTKFYPITYAVFVCIMGPCSTFLHAAFVTWTSDVDYLCMMNIATYLSVYGVVRLLKNGSKQLSAAALHCTVMALLILWTILCSPSTETSRAVFMTLLITAIVIEAVIRFRNEYCKKSFHQEQNQRQEGGGESTTTIYFTADLRLLFGSIFVFVLAMVIWIPSKSGAPLCFPDSIFQGHAVWHILTAVSLGLLFLYALSEHQDCYQGEEADCCCCSEATKHSRKKDECEDDKNTDTVFCSSINSVADRNSTRAKSADGVDVEALVAAPDIYEEEPSSSTRI